MGGLALLILPSHSMQRRSQARVEKMGVFGQEEDPAVNLC